MKLFGKKGEILCKQLLTSWLEYVMMGYDRNGCEWHRMKTLTWRKKVMAKQDLTVDLEIINKETNALKCMKRIKQVLDLYRDGTNSYEDTVLAILDIEWYFDYGEEVK